MTYLTPAEIARLAETLPSLPARERAALLAKLRRHNSHNILNGIR